MKKLWAVAAVAILFSTASCGGGSSSTPTASALLYHALYYTSGQGLTAELSLSDISLTAYSGSWGSEVSTEGCDGSYTAVAKADGRTLATFSGVTLPCKKRSKFTLRIISGNFVLKVTTEDL